MKTIKKKTLIMVYSGENNNKFYKTALLGSGPFKVNTNWGRVGATGQLKNYSFDSQEEAEAFYEKKIKSKERKGCREIEILENGKVAESGLENVALKQISFDKGKNEIKEFILRLVDSNIHQITEGYDIKIDKKTGVMETPLGIISQKTIDEGKAALDEIESTLERPDRKAILEQNENYYSRIPKTYRKIEDVLIDSEKAIKEAREYCEQLTQTLNFYTPKVKAEIKEQVFELEIDLSKDESSIERYFKESRNRQHGYLMGYDITNVYCISIKSVSDRYNKCKIGNEKLLWHGTKVSNMLSILKSGLMLPEDLASVEKTGDMFGYGLYFADQSTKSLQYCAGVAPGQHSRYDGDRLFMFLANVKMGREYLPRQSSSTLHRIILNSDEYDSTFAQANRAGLSNNEFIVYRTNQVNLTHIVELEQ